MLDNDGVLRSGDEIAKHFSADDVESALRDAIRLQWLLLKPEDRSAEQLIICIDEICKRLVPKVLGEFQE